MTNSKMVVIIGAGLSGTIAYNALRHYDPIVIEQRQAPLGGKANVHPAVMRLRDPSIAQLIGARFEKITVKKAAYLGQLCDKPSIMMNNLYSLKVYGELGNRSIFDLNENIRYILPDGYPVPTNTIWGCYVSKIEDSKIEISSAKAGEVVKKIDYDFCINTIPMPEMNNLVKLPRIEFSEIGSFHQIYVTRLRLKIPSSVHQTVYYPSPAIDIYRITITGKTIIIESTDKLEIKHEEVFDEILDLLSRSFGLDISYINTGSIKQSKMPIGKIKINNDDLRRNYIMRLTSEYNIFSFGRFAVWRPLRTDQLIGDIEKIKRMIDASDIENEYNLKLE